jgi:hypothetical protein
MSRKSRRRAAPKRKTHDGTLLEVSRSPVVAQVVLCLFVLLSPLVTSPKPPAGAPVGPAHPVTKEEGEGPRRDDAPEESGDDGATDDEVDWSLIEGLNAIHDDRDRAALAFDYIVANSLAAMSRKDLEEIAKRKDVFRERSSDAALRLRIADALAAETGGKRTPHIPSTEA